MKTLIQKWAERINEDYGRVIVSPQTKWKSKELLKESNPRLHKTNYNPWGKNIGDCAIRAISAGIGMSYVEICKVFGVSYKKGRGLIRTGIYLSDIKSKFNEYFGNITDFDEEIPDEVSDIARDVLDFEDSHEIDSRGSGITLNEFLELYGNGRFLVDLTAPEGGNHIVFANCSKGYFVDTYDSGDYIVDSWMQIVKTIPKDSPLHWKYDYENRKFIV